jgi:hypothetical protein
VPVTVSRVWLALGTRTRFLACALLLGGCIVASPAQSSGRSAIRPSLSVAPVPTVANRSPGTPRVSWSTGDGSPGEVTVTVNGGKEVLYASSAEGSSTAPWISVGQAYVFRLYSTGSGHRLLARLRVGKATVVIESVPRAPAVTSSIVNRLLQLISFGGVLLLATLAALYVREARRGG